MIDVGDIAPEFRLLDSDKQEIYLAAIRAIGSCSTSIPKITLVAAKG